MAENAFLKSEVRGQDEQTGWRPGNQKGKRKSNRSKPSSAALHLRTHGTSNLGTNTSSKVYLIKRLVIVYLVCDCTTAINCFQATGLTNLVSNPQDVASFLQPGKPSVSGVVSREDAGQATRVISGPGLLCHWPRGFSSSYEPINVIKMILELSY